MSFILQNIIEYLKTFITVVVAAKTFPKLSDNWTFYDKAQLVQVVKCHMVQLDIYELIIHDL